MPATVNALTTIGSTHCGYSWQTGQSQVMRDVGGAHDLIVFAVSPTQNTLYLVTSRDNGANWVSRGSLSSDTSYPFIEAACQTSDGVIHAIYWNYSIGIGHLSCSLTRDGNGNVTGFSYVVSQGEFPSDFTAIFLREYNVHLSLCTSLDEDGTTERIVALVSGPASSAGLEVRVCVSTNATPTASSTSWRNLAGTGNASTQVWNIAGVVAYRHKAMVRQNRSTKALVFAHGNTVDDADAAPESMPLEYMVAPVSGSTWSLGSTIDIDADGDGRWYDGQYYHPWMLHGMYATATSVWICHYNPEFGYEFSKLEAGGTFTRNAAGHPIKFDPTYHFVDNVCAFTAKDDDSAIVAFFGGSASVTTHTAKWAHWDGSAWTLFDEPHYSTAANWFAVCSGTQQWDGGCGVIVCDQRNVGSIEQAWFGSILFPVSQIQVGGDIELTCTGGAVVGGESVITFASTGVTFEARGATAHSTANGTSVSPSYAGLGTINPDTDAILLCVWQKPSTANGGTVTTPDGFTLVAEVLAAGGYGTTLGSNTGNTNLRLYRKNTVTGSEAGTLAITVGANNICGACFVRVSAESAGTFQFAASTGSDTTAGNLSITGGANLDLATGDLVLGAFCYPTNLATYTGQSLAETGATFGAVAESLDAGVTTGNRVGCMICYARVESGSASGTPTLTSTTGGTSTNARGPGALIAIRATTSGRTSTAASALSGFGSGAVGDLLLSSTATNACSSLGCDATGLSSIGIEGAATSTHGSLASEASSTIAVSGDASCVARALDSSATGSVAVVATAASAPAGVASSATAFITMSGSAMSAQQALTVVAAGAQTVLGSSADVVSGPSVAAAGSVSLSSTAASAPAAVASTGNGAALVGVLGSADTAVQPFASAASGAVTVAASATSSPSALASDGTGAAGVIGAGTSSQATLGSLAEGSEAVSASATSSPSALASAAVGHQAMGVSGTATGSLVTPTALGSGDLNVYGPAGASLARPASLAAATLDLLGSATSTARSAASLASGTEVVSGTAAGLLGAASSISSAIQSLGITGSAASELAPTSSTTTGTQTITGTANEVLQQLSALGPATVRIVGTVLVVESPMDSASIGDQSFVFTGAAASQLARPQADAIATISVAADASSTARTLASSGFAGVTFTGAASSSVAPWQTTADGTIISEIAGDASCDLRTFAGLGVSFSRPLQVTIHVRAQFINLHVTNAAILPPPDTRAFLLDEGAMATQPVVIGLGGVIEARFDTDAIVDYVEVGIKRANTAGTEQTFRSPSANIELMQTPADGAVQSYHFTSPPITMDGVWIVNFLTNFGLSDKELAVTVIKSPNAKLNEDAIT